VRWMPRASGCSPGISADRDGLRWRLSSVRFIFSLDSSSVRSRTCLRDADSPRTNCDPEHTAFREHVAAAAARSDLRPGRHVRRHACGRSVERAAERVRTAAPLAADRPVARAARQRGILDGCPRTPPARRTPLGPPLRAERAANRSLAQRRRGDGAVASRRRALLGRIPGLCNGAPERLPCSP
jgi:hypothetical protein